MIFFLKNLEGFMDAANLTTIATLLVALITGLLAYAATSSSKEKETKLAVFEKLGIETHAALERLQNNTEYLIQILLFSRSVNIESLRKAYDKVQPNYDKLRELRVRVMFFDEAMFLNFKKYFLRLWMRKRELPMKLQIGIGVRYPHQNILTGVYFH